MMKNFEQTFAKTISYLFHPLIMPTLGIFLVFNLDTYLSYRINPDAQLYISAIVFLNTAIIPVFTAFSLVKFGAVSSIYMREKQDRNIPFILTSFFYFFTYYLLKQYNLPQPIYALMLGAALAVVITLLTNFFWKISVHMVGIGGICGALFGLAGIFQTEVLQWLLPAVFIAGLIGFARMKLNAHLSSQIYSGFLVGFFCQWLILYWQIG
ncbi:MAG: hypothetical protein COA57_12835 [Flavobacteriales bacterium]|nr:MAG: hypothetical protein COA57_12835 [Flavobacteriales bacterium]